MTLLIIQLIRLETNGVVFIGAASTKTKKRAILIAQIALAIVAVACAAWLVVKAVGYNQAQLVYREMQAAYADDLGSGFDPDAGVNFDELKQKYPDVVGWLKMDDLDISYPIVQTTDNDHYLHYDAAGAPSIDGAIFLDYRNNSFADDLHALVYGHNMLDGSMFGTLQKYTDERFYKNGKGTFAIYTPTGAYQYEIFAVQVVDADNGAYTVGYKTAEVFDAFMRNLKEGSMYDTGVGLESLDHVVTLSTCTDTDRLIVSGKRIQAVEKSAAGANPAARA